MPSRHRRRTLHVLGNVGRRTLVEIKDAFLTPWWITWLGAWMTSSLTHSWAWIFAWGFAWILHYVAHDAMGELMKLNKEEFAGAAPHSLLATMGTIVGFMLVTGWVLVIWIASLLFDWDARPI
jgi:hypothetical protein